jgi:hypothetical protein
MMQGVRRDIVDSEWTTAEKGDYGKMALDSGWYWYGRVPSDTLTNYGLCDLSKHTVTENEDGTITVSPSILTWDGKGNEWHGFLERGVWREV